MTNRENKNSPSFSSLELSPILYVHLTLTVEILSDGGLPSFKSSMIRGAVASSVRRFACFPKRSVCLGCEYAGGCAYHFLFEPKKTVSGEINQNLYVIDCSDVRRRFSKGDFFSFDLKLFAGGVNYMAYVIRGLFDAQKKGFTKAGLEFRIKSINTLDGRVLYDGVNLEMQNICGELSPESCCSSPLLRMNFLTPFRTKVAGKLIRDFSVTAFIRSLVERVASLGMLPRDYGFAWMKRNLGDILNNIDVKHPDFRWEEMTRFSNRQKTAMQLGGIVGSCELSGAALADLIPLIKAGEIAHIGKATTFGLGKYRVEEKND